MHVDICGDLDVLIRARSCSVIVSECCRTQLSTMPLTPKDTHGSRSVNHRGSAPRGAVSVTSPGAQSQSTEALLQLILTKIEESDKRFAVRLDELDKKFNAVFEMLDERITSFTNRQETVNVDFARKLNRIPDALKIVEKFGGRLAALEAQSARLLSSQPVDRESFAASRVSGASDIIISGIPSSFTDTSGEVAESVFKALGIPRLVSDVLDTRDVVMRDAPVAGEASGSVLATDRVDVTSRKKSVIVALKSREIRNHILKVMRGRRRITISDVFSKNFPGNIYVNELLPTDTYNLLRRTRTKAKQSSFKHVWSRDGQIFVRRDHGQPPIRITSEADLTKLQ